MAVLVVTDNDIERCGVEVALAERGAEARAWDPSRWDGGSTPLAAPWQLVFVDVTPAASGWDRLQAASWLRWLQPSVHPEVPVVGWSTAALTAPARLRLARAGLTELVERPRRPTAADIVGLRDRSVRGEIVVPVGHALARWGLSGASDLEAGLALVASVGLQDAFEPGFQVSTGLARRASFNFRKCFARDVGLRTSPDRFSVMDDRDLTVPTWAEVARVVNHARGASARWTDDLPATELDDLSFGVATAS